MKSIVAAQQPVTALELIELMLGVDADPLGALFGGVAGESEEEWAARTDAARDILADLAMEAPELAAFAVELMRAAPVRLHRPRSGRRPVWSEMAA
ncbi:hypothetical protein [Kitasatospora sp. NBC_01302]|uniref:hypothetical protein n=1 Tax=Kitasatospora sp. NBC_01302 TaxID=2903575 RepID=UPI002E1076F5|nr:hypothetical protein OG294_19585 [Kitasatospora sp. NBC_01302]